MNWRLSKGVHLEGGVKAEDARRQTETAAEILRRFDELPGVVLADEVGMGKTFVALAVAVSVIEATHGCSPVVVMVPPSVRGKWPKEWRKLEARLDCAMEIRAAEASVTSASEFLKLLDDPPDRRKHLIFLTHGALHNALADPLLKLAIVRQALMSPRLQAQRRVFPRWAARVIPGLRYDERTCAALVATPISQWRRVLRSHTGGDPGDDPVPASVRQVLPAADLSALRNIIATQLPLRASGRIDKRLRALRRATASEVAAVWKQCLADMRLDLPLLILDEAHHAKNPGTKLAGLFANEAREDVEAIRGGLGGVFDRMLFLTATPFQLGHRELTEVLRRFTGVRWNDIDRDAYEQRLERLGSALDDMQAAALRLDRAWGRLTPGDVPSSDAWWSTTDGAEGSDALRAVASTWADVRDRTQIAADELRPLVIRHVRPDRDARRELWCGRSIATGNARETLGLMVDGPAVLPFLLAARAQAIVAATGARNHHSTRALFAEGLASSFEAYRRTRAAETAAAEVDDAIINGGDGELPPTTRWYLDHIANALPDDDAGAFAQHPKIAATVHRALELWREREKALVFCFYKATGRALRLHIARAIEQETVRLGADSLGISPDRNEVVLAELATVRERLFRPDSPARRFVEAELRRILGMSLQGEELTRASELTLRFLRTRSFLVRYTDLAAEPLPAMEAAFERPDASGRGLRELVAAFGEFISRREPSERAEYLDALENIGVGEISVRDDDGEREGLIANVRLANGAVAQPQRERLMIGFNTPFFPEVLVASSVMAEGVDLHLHCRHVIHHDLDWNPSVIEQRTGRLDRIDSKGEVTGLPVLVYEPFIEGTQDEKQFRVMKDRERWFNVVMGEKLELDEWTTDRLAERVPLPAGAAAELTMDLSIRRSGRS